MFVIGTVDSQRSKGKKFNYDYNFIDNSDNHLWVFILKLILIPDSIIKDIINFFCLKLIYYYKL